MYKVPILVDNKPLKTNSDYMESMKQVITGIAKANGCTASYSGNTKTMHIKGDNAARVVELSAERNPPFKVEVHKENEEEQE